MPFCTACGNEVLAGEAYCANCGAPLQASSQATRATMSSQPVGPGSLAPPKNVWLALLLSFVFPGLGQYYVGRRKKGSAFIAIAVILALTVLIGVGVVLYALFWLYNMVDAFLVLRKIDTGVTTHRAPGPVWYTPHSHFKRAELG